MFRRRWSGLPADPIFASDLKELGYVPPRRRPHHPSDRSDSVLTHAPFPSYFINDIDEIRSIENPDYYFKYFLTKNERWNERQRFAFNGQPTQSTLSPTEPNHKANPPPRSRPQRDPHAPRRPQLHDHPTPPQHPAHATPRPHPHNPQPNQRVARRRALPRVKPVAWGARAPRDRGSPRRGVARVGGGAGRGGRQAAG